MMGKLLVTCQTQDRNKMAKNAEKNWGLFVITVST